MPSKAQGLSLNTIVIAAIVLIVLLLLVGMVTGYFGNKWKPAFGRLTETSCKGQGGEEKAICAGTEKEIFAAETAEGKKCCAEKSCEERGGICCTGGTIEKSNDPGCKAKNPAAPNCCK